jgi:hypothetical protein
MARAMNSKIKRKSTIAIESNPDFDVSNVMIDQNHAYYESLEKDMEKELMLQIAEIDRQTKLAQQLKQLELEKEIQKQKEIEIQKEKEQNQPSKEEMRQRRLKFYEK